MKAVDVRRERRLRRREGYREIILHAAERIILRKGYSAMTMDDVAREAHLSKATIYKYISGKGALIFEIMSHQFDGVRDLVVAIVDGPGSAGDKLGRTVRVVIKNNEDMKNFNRVLWMDKAIFRLMRVFHHPPGKAAAALPADRKMLVMLRQKRQEIIDLGARIIGEGVASGEFRRMDTGQAAAFIEAVLQGYAHMRFWQGDVPPLPAAADGLTRFIIEGIRNPERSGKET
jgi:AcrR family transcriptional regulator